MSKYTGFQKVPFHLAIIMDGNGRWALKKGFERVRGHIEGIKALRTIIKASKGFGIKYLTAYAFSSENWQRPDGEVNFLMELLDEYLKAELPMLVKNKISLNFIGNINKLPENSRRTLLNVVEETKKFKDLFFTLALSYGSREEIVCAAAKAVIDSKKNILDPSVFDEKTFSSYLYTKNIPDPDFLIRTGGEKRISNFLLYQIAYTEIYFTKTMWPDFGRRELVIALKNYEKRARRFGKTEV